LGEIKGGQISYRIVGMPARDFPKLPDHREATYRIAIIARLAARAAAAATRATVDRSSRFTDDASRRGPYRRLSAFNSCPDVWNRRGCCMQTARHEALAPRAPRAHELWTAQAGGHGSRAGRCGRTGRAGGGRRARDGDA